MLGFILFVIAFILGYLIGLASRRDWKDGLADQLEYEEYKKKGWLP